MPANESCNHAPDRAETDWRSLGTCCIRSKPVRLKLDRIVRSLFLFSFSKSPRLPKKLEHFRVLFEEMSQIRKDFHSVRAKMMLYAFDVLPLGFGIEIE